MIKMSLLSSLAAFPSPALPGHVQGPQRPLACCQALGHLDAPHLLFISRSALVLQAQGMCVKMRVVLQMRALQNYARPGAQRVKHAVQPGARSHNTG